MHLVQTKSILSSTNGMNIYRGCTHGCIYCDSRSLCYQMMHPFEDVAVKIQAPELLDQALERKRKPCMIATGSMSDPYLPLEKELCLMRRCLEVIRKHQFGVTVLTKSDLILRDMDLLMQIHNTSKCVVQMTLTVADDLLSSLLEPNVCTTTRRYEVLCALRDAGIPTIVWLCPVLPFLTDTKENVLRILEYCASACVKGVVCFGMGLTLRDGNREYFYRQLDRLFPGMKQHYCQVFGSAYEVSSLNHCALMAMFHEVCESYGMMHENDKIFAYLGKYERKETQLSLF